MRRLYMLGAVCLLAALALLSCKQRQLTSENSGDFIREFENNAGFLTRKIALSQWDKAVIGQSDSLEVYRGLYRSITADPDLPARMKRMMTAEKDEKAAHKLELIDRVVLRQVVMNSEVTKALSDSILSLFDKRSFSFEGRTVSAEGLNKILATDNNRQKRREAYLSLIAPAANYSESVARLIRMRNQDASRIGYGTYFDVVLACEGIDKKELARLLADADNITAGPYQKILDSLKQTLNIPELSLWDIDYAFRRATGQSEAYFVQGNQMRLARETLAGLGWKLDALPIYFADAKGGSTNQLLTVAVPYDFRVLYSPADGYADFYQFIKLISEAVYGCNVDPGDFLLTDIPTAFMRDAVGNLLANLTRTDTWHRKYAGMPEPLVLSLKAKERFERLYRIRRILARIEFEMVLYKDPFADIDSKYRAIFEKYLKIQIPGDMSPWASDKAIITHTAEAAVDMYASCIESQLAAYLHNKYGELVDNNDTREFLIHNIFRFGAREDWRTLLERAAGEPFTTKYLTADIGN